jgi:hypothetical protein
MVLLTLRSPSPPVRSVRLQPDLTIEDVFVSRERLDDKLARARAWEDLPKAERERAPFEHSKEWAAQMHARLAGALEARAARPAEPNASGVRNARLYVAPRDSAHAPDPVAQGFSPASAPGSDPVAQGFSPVVEFPVAQGFSPASATGSNPVAQGFSPVSAQEHFLTSDPARARATGATALTADRIAADRAEGRLLASAQADGAWFGVSKVPLTLHTSQGKDALVADVPEDVIGVLRLVCSDLLVVIDGTK